MKNFDDYWKEKNEDAFEDQTKVPSGIACSVKGCEGELLADNTLMLLSYPPARNAVCGKCGTHHCI